ncbi:MAG: late competence development ComFB family protein [Alicyclobacillus herbarius]|nr:late competence development ComFB family protein [Alicyclobacillus herbarius]
MMEPLVWKEVERIAQNERDICFCSLCKSDITAYALNRLPARYVSTQEGETRFQELEIDDRVHETVVEAIRHVSKHPHRAHRTMTEYTVNELFDYMDEVGKRES